jgi:ABC-type lipoprotein release transport system permease subunit
VINSITLISVIGITLITAALVILLSAFNGIERMIEQLYSDFDPDISITSSKGKTFEESTINIKTLRKVDGIVEVSRAVDEIVVIKHEQKWVNARMVGIDSTFLSISKMKSHIVDGEPIIKNSTGEFGIIGATLLDKLGGFIPEQIGYETVQIYAPKRDAKVRLGSNPFKMQLLNVSSRMNFNREVNAEKIVVPLELARDLLNYKTDLNAIYVDVDQGKDLESVKAEIISLLGKEFDAKTNYEKNELIYKTSKSEKMIVIIILVFIFILAAFNLIASLTMLFVEKKENLNTLTAMGADHRSIFRIFFFEGLLISGRGIFFGLLLGYAVCFIQLQFGLLTMPNSGGEAFPIALSLLDGLLIFGLVSALSFAFSYFPVRILMNKYKAETLSL